MLIRAIKRAARLSAYGRWGVFIFCLALVLYAIFRAEPPQQLFRHSDKVGHFLGFAALTLSAGFARQPRSMWWFGGGLMVFAAGFEWLQPWVSPRRLFSVDDMAANLAGVFIGVVVYRMLSGGGRGPTDVHT